MRKAQQSRTKKRPKEAALKKSPLTKLKLGVTNGRGLEHKQPIRVVVDSKRHKFSNYFPLLADSYSESSLATVMVNKMAELYRDAVEPRIEEIKKRKNLSVNEVQTDKEIIALLNQRDSERRRLTAALFDAIFERRKRSSDRESLEAEIHATIKNKNMKIITYATLAKALKRQSADALRVETRRVGLSIKDFKKTNR